MPNPRGNPESLSPAPKLGNEALPRKAYPVKVEPDLAAILDRFKNRSPWMRAALREKALLEGLLKNDNWEDLYAVLYEVLQAMPIEERVAWMQQKLTEAAIADGLIEPDESPPLE